MKKSKRLTPIAQLAHSKEKDAAMALAALSKTVEDRRLRLADLEKYLKEYQARFTQTGQASASAAILKDFLRFIAKLNYAIMQQQKLLKVAEQEFNTYKRHWETMHAKTAALDKAIERYRGQELAAESAREQKDADEWSLRPPEKKA